MKDLVILGNELLFAERHIEETYSKTIQYSKEFIKQLDTLVVFGLGTNPAIKSIQDKVEPLKKLIQADQGDGQVQTIIGKQMTEFLHSIQELDC